MRGGDTVAELSLNINVTGSETIDSDLNAFKVELGKMVSASMNAVGANMQEALARHIETDVYDQYSPKTYERRYENGGLVAQARTARVYNHGAGVTLEYKPDGMHPTEARWHKVDGDELIGRIEKHEPEYNWQPKKKKIPNRPFWQNFVDELVDEKELERYFVDAMRENGATDIIGDGDVIREANDGNY